MSELFRAETINGKTLRIYSDGTFDIFKSKQFGHHGPWGEKVYHRGKINMCDLTRKMLLKSNEIIVRHHSRIDESFPYIIGACVLAAEEYSQRSDDDSKELSES